jgi:hypothetical protein
MGYHYATELYGAYGESAVNTAFQKCIVQCPAQHYTMHGTGATNTPSPTTTAIPSRNWAVFVENVKALSQHR